MSSALLIGLVVVVQGFWSEYDGCSGIIRAVAQKTLLITEVQCTNGDRYEYIAGIPVDRVVAYDSDRHRPRNWRVK